ncbi:two-component system, NtrC family, sensor kinase [Thermodesulforhabdus norvegica]|uniref:histidine kinase n=2 Tax=Thermodesulforhabdus norvegica TaxID=39841 RepID=A0A1I4SHC0_9BACT|nr:two-component system, NtrC family, sensor kinase [Thermodesulforhabdus norvegica]
MFFSVMPIAILGTSIYYEFHRSYTRQVTEYLRSIVEDRRHALDLFFRERIAQLSTVAHTNSVEQLKDEEYLEYIFRLMQGQSRFYIDLGVITQKGDHIAYCGPYALKGVNYSDARWFREVMRRGTYISDVFLGVRQYPHFIVAVSRHEEDRWWILRATINTDFFESLVKTAQIGEGGDAFLLNEAGVYQTTPRFQGKLLDAIPGFRWPHFRGTRVVEMDFRGSRSLVGTAWLETVPWLLVITIDLTEELKPLHQAGRLSLIIGLGGVAIVFIGAFLVSRAMINQLIEAEREKEALDASLLQSSKMMALGRLAAGIAHEINNPLSVIKEKAGWLRDLLEEEDISSSKNFQEFADAVEKIEYHVDRARTVTHRLLGFARRMEPVQESVDLHRILEECLSFIENEAFHRNIKIVRNFDPELPLITTDPSQLQQVFLNILNNAMDAVDKDGTVWIDTYYDDFRQQVVIRIADSGPGIPENIIDRIFDPFVTTKALGKGTGLGLSITYSIVQKLGGRITAENAAEEGKGAVFTVLLPVKAPV